MSVYASTPALHDDPQPLLYPSGVRRAAAYNLTDAGAFAPRHIGPTGKPRAHEANPILIAFREYAELHGAQLALNFVRAHMTTDMPTLRSSVTLYELRHARTVLTRYLAVFGEQVSA